MKVKQLTRITDVSAAAWNALAGSDYPFLRHEFLTALENSASVSPQTGWSPRHLLVYRNDEPIALMPLYLKTHSYGEYVFDQSWAEAYRRHGLNYYPKWLTAIPFTPCQGPRIAIKNAADRDAILNTVFDFIRAASEDRKISSWHCLFPAQPQAEQLHSLGLLLREDVQFQWFNKGYRDFDDYLQTFNSAKRKMIKRERRRVCEAGVELLTIPGNAANEAQWQAFYRFYAATYVKKFSQPYLNADFFSRCATAMGERMLLVLALKDGRYVAAALSFIGGDTLYGRYWGCHREFDALHFETCYYRGLDYCIRHGLQRFDSGAQGEHKIARGFEPIRTYSAHWLKNAAFAQAVEGFLIDEKQAVKNYRQAAANYLPFKK
ncbi:MAG: GNAT family N-acetyltransferase [Gammaproteobacteria bacterium]